MQEFPQLSGKRLLIPIRGKGQIRTNAEETSAVVSGELVVEMFGDHPTVRGLRITRFGLVAGSAKGKRGATGTITVIGDGAIGTLKPEERGYGIDIEIPARINYESLDRALVKDMDKGCYYRPAFEPCSVRVTGLLVDQQGRMTLPYVTVNVVCAAGEFEEVLGVNISVREIVATMVNPTGGIVQDFSANSGYDPCIQVNPRQLTVQPVGFRTDAADPAPTGGTAAAQFGTAQTVWAKACIQIDVLPFVYIDDATLKTSTDLTAIRAAYTDPDPNVIEVYFIDNPLPAIGGGSAGAIGVASCKVVVAEPNGGNPVLMAHELGHVLGLLHPPSVNSDPGTVMQPTGSAMNPGTPFVTWIETQSIANPVLQTVVAPCCLTHDKGDHYLRDFPVDSGLEPSDPLPAGMTRYSMSNVWNRLTNTVGTFSATTGPEHESPYRFENDGTTPYTNYLFAQVEQISNFPVRDATVTFYLKTPGSGGGAANLDLLGSVVVPGALALGSPQNVVLPWTVPAGTPNHSCCFAVVNSPEEPEGNPNSLTWAQFEDMSHQDNDWAQRNLDIADTAPNLGSGNVESAPYIIRIPRGAEVGRLPLTMTVATRGRGLRSVELEVPGVETVKVDPGKPTEVKFKYPVVEGEDSPIIIRGTLEPGLPAGTRVDVLVDPRLGKVHPVGFGAGFRVAKTKAAIAQFLDRGMAAISDCANATDNEQVLGLEQEFRSLFALKPCSAKSLAAALTKQLRSLASAGKVIAALPAAERFGVPGAFKRLQKAVRGTDPVEVIEAFASFAGRSHMAVATGGAGVILAAPEKATAAG